MSNPDQADNMTDFVRGCKWLGNRLHKSLRGKGLQRSHQVMYFARTMFEGNSPAYLMTAQSVYARPPLTQTYAKQPNDIPCDIQTTAPFGGEDCLKGETHTTCVALVSFICHYFDQTQKGP